MRGNHIIKTRAQRRVPIGGWAILAVCCLQTLALADVSVSLVVEPATGYVNQWRTLHLTLRAPETVSFRDLTLQGLPDESILPRLPLTEAPLEHRQIEGRTYQLRRYRIRVRPVDPGALTFRPVLHAVAVTRQTRGWLRSWNEQRLAPLLPEIRIEARALPEANRPDTFGGAVGQFSLQGDIAPETLLVGDLLTVRLQLDGTGWLAESRLETGAPAPGIQAYPLRELHRDPLGELRAEHVFVVGVTNRTQIPETVFWYFDPETGRYHATRHGPVPIQAAAADPDALAKRVAHLDRPPPAPQHKSVWKPFDPSGIPVFWGRVRAVLVVLFLAAVAVAIWKLPRFRRVPLIVRTLVRVAGVVAAIVIGMHLDQQARRRQVRIDIESPFHLGPSERSRVIGTVPPGTTARILEDAGEWIQILVRGQTGWIRSQTVLNGDVSSKRFDPPPPLQPSPP